MKSQVLRTRVLSVSRSAPHVYTPGCYGVSNYRPPRSSAALSNRSETPGLPQRCHYNYLKRNRSEFSSTNLMEDDQQVVQFSMQVAADGDSTGHGRRRPAKRWQRSKHLDCLVQQVIHEVYVQRLRANHVTYCSNVLFLEAQRELSCSVFVDKFGKHSHWDKTKGQKKAYVKDKNVRYGEECRRMGVKSRGGTLGTLLLTSGDKNGVDLSNGNSSRNSHQVLQNLLTKLTQLN